MSDGAVRASVRGLAYREAPRRQRREEKTLDLNNVTLTGNLTRDPELHRLPSGTCVCRMRVASNRREKNEAGDWVDRPNYFNVRVWGAQGEQCATYLSKGRGVALRGELRWREWADDDHNKRQGVEIVAREVKFLPAPAGGQGANAAGEPASPPSEPEVAADDHGLPAVPEPLGAGVGSAEDDDLPF